MSDDKVRDALALLDRLDFCERQLSAGCMATVSSVPYADAPQWSPFTRFISPYLEELLAIRKELRAILASDVLATVRADVWDEVAQALAWAQENGPDPIRYVTEHNPYRARP